MSFDNHLSSNKNIRMFAPSEVVVIELNVHH